MKVEPLSTRVVITLPWPEAVLSPNSRAHWRRRHAAARSYKHTAWVLARHALLGRLVGAEGAIRLSLEFFPPVKRTRDVDNLIASMKSGLDGIALGLGVDDTRFHLQAAELRAKVKGGRVVVTLEFR